MGGEEQTKFTKALLCIGVLRVPENHVLHIVHESIPVKLLKKTYLWQFLNSEWNIRTLSRDYKVKSKFQMIGMYIVVILPV